MVATCCMDLAKYLFMSQVAPFELRIFMKNDKEQGF